MKHDKYGQPVIDSHTLFNWLYQNPKLDINNINLVDPEQYNASLDQLHLQFPRLSKYSQPNVSIEEFDCANQSNWYIPEHYKSFDIVRWVVEQCSTDVELVRVAEELVEFDRRNLLPLLVYLKYFVDVMRENGIVWGVGRGSSVASYVLYKIGVHKIDSLKYNLKITEFLKEDYEEKL